MTLELATEANGPHVSPPFLEKYMDITPSPQDGIYLHKLRRHFFPEEILVDSAAVSR